jgi:hypothetical protein
MVGVRVECHDVSLQQVRLAGGRWNPAQRVWELRRDQALKLGLKDWSENVKASIRKNYKVCICLNVMNLSSSWNLPRWTSEL